MALLYILAGLAFLSLGVLAGLMEPGDDDDGGD